MVMTRLPRTIVGVGLLGLMLVASAFLSVSLPILASGQEGEAEKALSLTAGDVRRLRQQAEEAKDLNEESKTKVLETYDKALTRLEASVDWSNKAADFDRVREEAPQATEALEKELKADLPESRPELPEDASLDQLEQALMEVKFDQETVNEQLNKLESEVTRRREGRKKVPELLAAARQRLLQAREQGPKDAAGPPALLEAQRTLREATIIASEAEIAALRREVPSYEARTKLLTLRLDQTLRIQAAKEKEAEFWQEKVREGRRQEAERAAREAREALLEVTEASPEIRQFAEELAAETAQLAEQRTGPDGILEEIEAISARTGETKELLKKVQADFASVEKRVEAGRLSAPIGALLHQRRADLPDVGDRKRDIRARRDEIEKAQLKLIEVREERLEVSDVQSVVSKKMSGVDPSLPEYQRRRMERLLQELLWKKRSSLQSLLNDYTTYFEKLMELDAGDRELVDTVQEFDSFIDERILWIRSVEPFRMETRARVWSSVKWMVRPDNWKQVVQALGRDVSHNLAVYILVILLLLGVLAGRRKMAIRLRAVHEEAGKPWCTEFALTVEALLLTLLTVALRPVFLWMLGWRLRALGGDADFLNAIGSALEFTAVMYLTLEIPRQVFKPDGLGRLHFGWTGDRLDDMYKILGRAFVIVLPAVFVIAAADGQADEALKVALVRVAFVFLMFAVSVMLFTMLRPRLSGQGREASVEGGRPVGVGRFWYVAIVTVPLAIGVVEYLGYYYAARELGLRLLATACLVIAVFILQGMILRWLLLARRRLAIEENQEHREAPAKKASGEEEAATKEPEKELDLAIVQVQTNRLLRGIIFFTLVIGIWWIWVEVVTAFGILREVDLWHTTQQVSQTVTDAEGNSRLETVEQLRAVTLADLLLALVILLMTVMATRNLPGLLQVVLLQRFGLGTGERAAISTIVQHTIIVIGGSSIFKIMGVGWGNIQWLVAALGVGIGFGLQEIVANFISGLILLFERPIRVGDTVTVGDVSGTVSKIRIRATSITGWDRKELIVPNKEFVTGRLVNWTFSDPILRVEIPVGIAYGSDTEKARERMLEVARENRNVLHDPPPSVIFMAFGASSLDFVLRAFTKIDTLLSVRDELNMAVDKAFREAGIEIAFPQRDIHIRSVKDTFPIASKEPDEKG
jgi:potassium efflux system protein